MDHEIEPGSKDALYDEIRRRLIRNQNRDRIDAYNGAVGDVRDSVARTSDTVGVLLGSPVAVWAAGILTVFLAGAAIFVALDPDWNEAPAEVTDARPQVLVGDIVQDGD